MTKKLFSLFLGLSILFTPVFEINAASMSSEISFEVYSSTLINKYSDYGVEIEMQPKDENFVFTQELLEEELGKVEKNVQNLTKGQTIFSPTIEAYGNQSQITPFAMYATKTASNTYSYSNLSNPLYPLRATIKVNAPLYVDIQRNTIIEAGKPTLSVMSAVGYADYIELVSYSTSIDNSSSNISRDHADYYIICLLKEEMSIGGVTSWAKVTCSFVIEMNPF